jgi:hypothetical protein
MKFPAERPYANPEAAARKLIEIANTVEAVQERPYLHREDQLASRHCARLALATR